ncbi:2-amino-4-hydroxy-6-hydroxymethyldihydropteridine diphosphokinase [Lysobacter korlensis]|uniref:2-amino-4-hydroxy-6-hydroxymethyldihydropteridine pyrophosphokinase n=1 Tax=Lysobacter korlensis TaxID=553636 RepID=A0ABV6RU97_9GAMM
MTSRRTVLALGSNLGERRPTMLEAVRRIADLPTTELQAISEPIDTVAVKPEGEDPTAPKYLNSVVILTTALAPETLLDELHRIEADLGRVRAERWGDRTLDIDIVTMEGVVIDSARLTLPHPRAHERRFVLEPWASIDPDAELPGRGRVDELLRRLGEGG